MHLTKTVVLACILFLAFNPAFAQQETPTEITFTPQQGFRVESPDGSMGFRLGFRLQQQFSLTAPLYDESVLTDILIRRARTQFRGFIFDGKMDYFIQLGMDRGSVSLLNAEYRWRPDDNTMIAFGQLFPPSGRQFHTVSKNFQMIDRSPVSRFFFMGWDMGMRIDRTFELSDQFAFKTKAAVTHGEGRNTRTAAGGWAYTGRLDVLPFGLFTKGGDYSESDLVREPTPKLALGTAYYMNTDAYVEYDNAAWDGVDDDIRIFYADLVFKYNGFSLLTEYIKRTLDNERLVFQPDEILYSDIISGEGVSVQGGKFISETMEPTFRVSLLNPDDDHQTSVGSFIRQQKYTLGLNKFFIGHTLKLQGEVGYVAEQYQSQDERSYLEFLLQFQLSF